MEESEKVSLLLQHKNKKTGYVDFNLEFLKLLKKIEENTRK